MTDLEITKACAEAMGFEPFDENGKIELRRCDKVGKFAAKYSYFTYDPLHDDAQAMALVKKWRLRILPQFNGMWCADTGEANEAKFYVIGHGDTANRAICVCGAKIWESHAQR